MLNCYVYITVVYVGAPWTILLMLVRPIKCMVLDVSVENNYAFGTIDVVCHTQIFLTYKCTSKSVCAFVRSLDENCLGIKIFITFVYKGRCTPKSLGNYSMLCVNTQYVMV